MSPDPQTHHQRRARRRLASRWLHRLAVLITVILAIYVVVAVYSTAVFFEGLGQDHLQQGSILLHGDDLVLPLYLNVSNPGIVTVNSFSVTALVTLPDGLPLTSPQLFGPVALGSGVRSGVELQLAFPLTTQGPLATLIANDSRLQTYAWVNATQGGIFAYQVEVSGYHHWGAPFANLTLQVGTASAGSLPFQLSFQDNSPLESGGVLNVTAFNAAGTACGTGTVGPFEVGPGSSYQAPSSSQVPLAAGCDPHGGGWMVVQLGDAGALSGTLARQGVP